MPSELTVKKKYYGGLQANASALVVTSGLLGCGGSNQNIQNPPPIAPSQLLISANQSGQPIVVDANTDQIIRTVPAASPGKMVSAGCLSIFDTAAHTATTVLVPATRTSFDVTALVPVPGRNVLYAVQGGKLDIFDITTGAPRTTITPPAIPGNAFGVVLLRP